MRYIPEHPAYGNAAYVVETLSNYGISIGRQRVEVVKHSGLEAVYPKANLSKA